MCEINNFWQIEHILSRKIDDLFNRFSLQTLFEYEENFVWSLQQIKTT